jgi:Ca-activated chloride channel family protein
VRALEDVQLGAQPATEVLLEAQRAAGEALPQLRQDPGLRPQTPLAAGTTDEFRAESLLRQAEAENLTQRFRKAAPQPLVFELQPGEELWVIARSATSEQSADRAPQPHSEIPGCGALAARLPGDTVLQPVPLKHTAVNAQIDGYISSVDVTQQFHNPWSTLIEAEYVFPLPENAAVHDFVMQVGDRRIRGIIREREKAEQIYSQARAQGHTASLLTQERPNIFTQKVANIEPGQQIDIQIRYFSTLRYDSGAFEFVFPMVVGPRFNPAWTSDGIGAVSRHEPGASGQSTEVPYLTPGERSGHDVSLTVHINAGMNIEDIRSVNHRVDVQTVSECERGVVLSASDTIPNRDFVLRYTVAGDQIRSTLLTHSDKAGQYFTMLVCPPAELRHMQRSPSGNGVCAGLFRKHAGASPGTGSHGHRSGTAAADAARLLSDHSVQQQCLTAG